MSKVTRVGVTATGTATSTAAATAAASTTTARTRATKPWRNWARTEQVTPARVERPASGDEVVDAIVRARTDGLPVKAIGSGHSFTGIAVAPGVQLDLTDLAGVTAVYACTGLVTLAAGTRRSHRGEAEGRRRYQ